MKKIFKIDAALYPLGLLTAATGFAFHAAGHGTSHQQWEVWAYAHSIVAMAFVAMIIQHLTTHKGWVKGLRDMKLWAKRKFTMLLGVVAVVAAATGVALLAIQGANTHTGAVHYRLGIALVVVGLSHSAKRLPTLLRAIKKIRQQ
ncbi:MAG: hypothetical protein Q4B68_00035 [Bacteroidales bacterium]|nr:hypothetical protein [Bacteroidales bacterium]